MITIGNTLEPSAIKLDLAADSPASAVFEIAARLREDDRVKDWEALVEALAITPACVVDEAASGLCLPHARTDAVRTMVIGAGRSSAGIRFPGTEKLVRYVFVIGVPVAMASDYLRIVGALMRIFRQETVERQLRECDTAADFLSILVNCEMKL